MILSKDQLSGFRPSSNFILTTPAVKADRIKCGDTELYQDTSYNPQWHQPVVHRVVSVCKYLTFGRSRQFVEIDQEFDERFNHKRVETFSIDTPLRNSIEWRTNIEVKAGDTVWVDVQSVGSAAAQNRLIECDGHQYYLVKYSDVYLKLVDGKPEMLNGWVLAAPVTKPEDDLVKSLKSRGLVFPSISVTADNRKMNQVRDHLAIIRHIGLPVDEYLDPDIEDTDEIAVGDTVVLLLGANRRLESEAHRWFSREEELIVTRRPRVTAIIREEMF